MFTKELTNNALAKVFSVDFFLAVVAAIFLSGVVWNSLNNSIAQAQEQIEDTSKTVNEITTDVNAIKTDIAVITVKQTQVAEDVKGLKEDLKEYFDRQDRKEAANSRER